MSALHFPAELPVQCVRDLVTAVRDGDYTSAETVDHALYAAGCVNALRESFPTPFGAAEVVSDASSCDDAKLCGDIETLLPAGFVVGSDAAAASPALLALISELVMRVLSRFIRRD